MNKKLETVAKKIQKAFPHVWLKDGEDFNGSKGALWSGEGSDIDDIPAFDHYSDNSLYIMGVHHKLADLLTKLGYYAEFYDAGTVLIYKF